MKKSVGGRGFVSSPTKLASEFGSSSPKRARPANWGEEALATRPRVLLIDDDATFVAHTSSFLEAHGYHVATADNPALSEDLFMTFSPDVVLADVRLADDANGLDLVERFLSRRHDVRFVVMTGYAGTDEVVRALRLGVADFLHKPLDSAQLADVLARCSTGPRRRKTDRLSDNELFLSALVEHVDEGIVTVSSQGFILSANRAAERLFGHGAKDLRGRRLFDLLATDDDALDELDNFGADREPREYMVRDGAGRLRTVQIKISEMVHGAEPVTVATVWDTSANKEKERWLKYTATHDALTGLPNRTVLHHELPRMLALAERLEQHLVVVCLHIERLGRLNETLGQHAADLVLREVSERLGFLVRRYDTVARSGSDHFSIVGLVREPQHGALLAERALEAVRQPMVVGGVTHVPRASAGVALSPQDGTRGGALLGKAHRAMRKAASLIASTAQVSA